MLNRLLFRGVSLLLIPCLLLQPGLAKAFTARTVSADPAAAASRFEQEALQAAVLNFIRRPLGPSLTFSLLRSARDLRDALARGRTPWQDLFAVGLTPDNMSVPLPDDKTKMDILRPAFAQGIRAMSGGRRRVRLFPAQNEDHDRELAERLESIVQKMNDPELYRLLADQRLINKYFGVDLLADYDYFLEEGWVFDGQAENRPNTFLTRYVQAVLDIENGRIPSLSREDLLRFRTFFLAAFGGRRWMRNGDPIEDPIFPDIASDDETIEIKSSGWLLDQLETDPSRRKLFAGLRQGKHMFLVYKSLTGAHSKAWYRVEGILEDNGQLKLLETYSPTALRAPSFLERRLESHFAYKFGDQLTESQLVDRLKETGFCVRLVGSTYQHSRFQYENQTWVNLGPADIDRYGNIPPKKDPLPTVKQIAQRVRGDARSENFKDIFTVESAFAASAGQKASEKGRTYYTAFLFAMTFTLIFSDSLLALTPRTTASEYGGIASSTAFDRAFMVGTCAALAIGSSELWGPLFKRLREEKQRLNHLTLLAFLDRILFGADAARYEPFISTAARSAIMGGAFLLTVSFADSYALHLNFIYIVAKAALTIVGFMGARAAWKAWPGIRRRVLTAALTLGFIFTFWNPNFEHHFGRAFEDRVTEVPVPIEAPSDFDKINRLFHFSRDPGMQTLQRAA